MSLSTLHPEPSTSAPQLVARDLRRSFEIGRRKIEVLRGISVDIQQGEAVFLCGASGAGKTTLLYTLAGLERPESGTVEFEGTALYQGGGTEEGPIKRFCRTVVEMIHRTGEAVEARIRNERIGFVFQGYFLLSELTALENAMLPSMIGGRPTREAAEQALVDVGLADRFHHLPAELSGGEQQRVAIARSLNNDPTIVFADEPTGNLDSKTGEGIIELLLDLVRKRNKTLVVVTHDSNLALRGDRRLEIRDGLLVA